MGSPLSFRDRLDHRWSRQRRWARVHDYLDGELSGRQRRRLLHHADICPECGPMLRSLVTLLFELRELGRRRPGAVAPALIERLHSEALGEGV